MLLRNPKDGSEIEVNFDEEKAAEICRNSKDSFARDLASKRELYGKLSASQYFWLFKKAKQLQPKEKEFLQLATNLQEFISVVETMQFRIEGLGKVLLRRRSDCITVHCAYRCVGRIVGDRFYHEDSAWPALKTQILLFGANPQMWMENYGKATGYCCVCGRELTNEESVQYGIGPICREKFGF